MGKWYHTHCLLCHWSFLVHFVWNVQRSVGGTFPRDSSSGRISSLAAIEIYSSSCNAELVHMVARTWIIVPLWKNRLKYPSHHVHWYGKSSPYLQIVYPTGPVGGARCVHPVPKQVELCSACLQRVLWTQHEHHMSVCGLWWAETVHL